MADSGVPAPSRFAATLFDILDTVSYRRVPLEDRSDPVFRLRYEAYMRENFIAPNPERIVTDEFDEAPNVMCYGVYIGEDLVSSLRMHLVTPDQRISPSRLIYPEILGGFLDAGESYIDPSRFTADRDASLAYPALPFLTLRLAVMASVYYKVTYCLSSVRAEHAAFYRRVFQSRQMGEERIFPGLDFPVQLYVTEVETIRMAVAGRFPFFMSTEEEKRQLFEEGHAGFGEHVAPTARRMLERVRQGERPD